MLENSEIIDLIIKYSEEHGITAYEISQNTNVSTPTAFRILKRETENPRRKNLLEILDYIESKRVGSRIPGHRNYQPNIVAEPHEDYKPEKSKTDMTEVLLLNMKLFQHVAYLEKLLRDNNIDYKQME